MIVLSHKSQVPLPAWPPPVSGSVAAVACHYNWAGYDTPRRNLQRWQREMTRSGVPVIGVELVLDGQVPTMSGTAGWCCHTVSNRALLWQKEALLNSAIQVLPPNIEHVLMLDTDVWFERPDWLDATIAALDRHPVVQPWSRCHWTDISGKSVSELISAGSTRSMGKGGSWNSHPGFAWAFRRDFLEAIGGWYAWCPLGSGDVAMAWALVGDDADLPGRAKFNMRIGDQNLGIYEAWRRKVVVALGSSQLGSVEGDIWHDWHGDHAQRDYIRRMELLPHLNVRRDLRQDDGGWLEWTAAAPGNLVAYTKDYFNRRREDGAR